MNPASRKVTSTIGRIKIPNFPFIPAFFTRGRDSHVKVVGKRILENETFLMFSKRVEVPLLKMGNRLIGTVQGTFVCAYAYGLNMMTCFQEFCGLPTKLESWF